jgi:pimeloyl-ACP methyl ester carboxylesterase
MGTTSELEHEAEPLIRMFTTPSGEDSATRAYRRILSAWPVSHDELTVPTSFGDTNVTVSGPPDGPPVVLLHALFATAMSWYRNVEAISQTHRTYCVDVIGEANMSRPIKPCNSLDDFLGWFTEVIDGLAIDTLYLAGNSYGGFTAAYYAMKLPDRVQKLVLIGPASTIHGMGPFYRRMFIPKGLYLMAPWMPGADRVMRSAVEWMHAGLTPDQLWEPLFQDTMRHGVLINRVMPRVYTREEMAQITAPVLLVFGDREVIYGDLIDAISAGKELIPGAEVAVIPDAHHIAALANPEAFNDRVLEFLAEG